MGVEEPRTFTWQQFHVILVCLSHFTTSAVGCSFQFDFIGDRYSGNELAYWIQSFYGDATSATASLIEPRNKKDFYRI